MHVFCACLCAADALLASKAHKQLLQPYQQRADAAVGFMLALHPPVPQPANGEGGAAVSCCGVEVTAGALQDPKVWVPRVPPVPRGCWRGPSGALFALLHYVQVCSYDTRCKT